MAEIPPPFFTACAPDCDGTITSGLGSGPCVGRYPWTIQCRAAATFEAVGAPSVGRPIFMRLLEADPFVPIPGDGRCWNGSWQGFVRYGPFVPWAGDVIYLPSEPTPMVYTMEAKQGIICGVSAFCYSTVVTCKIEVGAFARTTSVTGLETIRFRVYKSDDDPNSGDGNE